MPLCWWHYFTHVPDSDASRCLHPHFFRIIYMKRKTTRQLDGLKSCRSMLGNLPSRQVGPFLESVEEKDVMARQKREVIAANAAKEQCCQNWAFPYEKKSKHWGSEGIWLACLCQTKRHPVSLRVFRFKGPQLFQICLLAIFQPDMRNGIYPMSTEHRVTSSMKLTLFSTLLR